MSDAYFDSGYVVVYLDGRKQRLHRIAVERALGKPLPRGAVVHHVNGDRLDNRPANLVVCDPAYHRLLHVRQAAFDATGDANKIRCEICGVHDDRANLAVRRRGQQNGYHLSCASERMRGYRAASRARASA